MRFVNLHGCQNGNAMFALVSISNGNPVYQHSAARKNRPGIPAQENKAEQFDSD